MKKNLRFEIDYKLWRKFWDVGIELLHLRTKNEILEELLKIAENKYSLKKV